MSTNTQEIVKEIGDLNLTYLLLAQKMLRLDRVSAMLRLGLSNELADMLVGMSLSQVIRMAAGNVALCGFRLEQLPPVRALMDEGKDPVLHKAHVAIVLASQARAVAAA
jgi:flagellar transcriptional activator FlhD